MLFRKFLILKDRIGDNFGFYITLAFFVIGLSCAITLPLLQKSLIDNSLEKILNSDCEFFNPDEMTPEEYFNRESNIASQISEDIEADFHNENNEEHPSDAPEGVGFPIKPTKSANFATPDFIEVKKPSLHNNTENFSHLIINDEDHDVIKSHNNSVNGNINPSQNKQLPLFDVDNFTDINRLVKPKINTVSIFYPNSKNNNEPPEIALNNNFINLTNSDRPLEYGKNVSKVISDGNSSSNENSHHLRKGIKRKNLFLYDRAHEVSNKDYGNLRIADLVKYDRRGFLNYMWDHLLEDHALINLFFKKSLFEPIFIRVFLFVYVLSMGFAINAMLFSDDYIDKRAEADKVERDNFFYTLIEETPKSIISLVITSVLETLLRLIIIIPKKIEEEFNDVLKTKDKILIKEAK